MDIEEIKKLTNGRYICGESGSLKEIHYAFASDFMSDVLTLDVEDMVLITGLCNLQTIRTAEIADIHCVVFVRDKRPTEEMIALAQANGIVLIRTAHSMYHASGVLFQAGLRSIF